MIGNESHEGGQVPSSRKQRNLTRSPSENMHTQQTSKDVFHLIFLNPFDVKKLIVFARQYQ